MPHGDGPSSEIAEENNRLRKQLAEAERAKEILKAASPFFPPGTRPSAAAMTRFIDGHRERFGVAAICRALGWNP